MSNILITIKKELRAILRDKKSLMMMLVIPLMIPLYLILFSYVYDDMMSEKNDVESKEYLVGINYSLTEEEQTIAQELNLNTEYGTKEELSKMYEDKKISAYIIKKDNKYTIYSNTKEQNSAEVTLIASQYLESYNYVLGHEYLANFPVDFDKVDNSIVVETEELKGTSEAVNMLLFVGVIYAMMGISLTAIYGVTDTIAGEKERGTLETLLTFPIKSSELVIGKYLAITISCIISSILSTILIILSLSISSNLFSIYDDAIININIFSLLITMLLMISYSIFVSGLCITIASFTKSYKEAQSSLAPVNFITMIPMIFYVTNITLDAKISLIPIVSHTMFINDLITIGLTNNTILYLIIILLSTLVYSSILIYVIIKLFKNEKVLFSN
ncbi:MAG: ABC transporter permease subunit [Bacilli bacterium]|nr:ABC transporter permease subunit [Bacilli bacterium]